MIETWAQFDIPCDTVFKDFGEITIIGETLDAVRTREGNWIYQLQREDRGWDAVTREEFWDDVCRQVHHD